MGASRDKEGNLSVLCYHTIMVIYPYPFFVVITQFFSWIILINDCICILTGSPGQYVLMNVYVIRKNWGETKILQFYQRNGRFPLSRRKQGNYPGSNYHIWAEGLLSPHLRPFQYQIMQNRMQRYLSSIEVKGCPQWRTQKIQYI